MKTYKGTDKDMKCRNDFQYTLGETYTDDGAVRCGNKGFHSCEAPFDVLRYFPVKNGNRYFECEADGAIDGDAEDTKIASSEITLKAEIGLPGLIKAQIAYTKRKAESGITGNDRSNLAGGNDSNLAGGESCILVGRNPRKMKAGLHSVLVFTEWEWKNNRYVMINLLCKEVDGEEVKADTWYICADGTLKEVADDY